jgi:phosphonate degradation associated HDIG domain protein
METESIRDRIEEIFRLYESQGSREYVGEPVSLLEHMSQSAQLAIQDGADAEVILAAFFHDIGHLCVASTTENDMDGLGTKNHEIVGAEYLRQKGFPDRLTDLVKSHVAAKRYLTFRHPVYFRSLSPASRQTLERQGGRMTEAEANAFESNPLFEYSIKLRKWDEKAKRIHIRIIDLSLMKSMAEKVLAASTQAAEARV